MIRRAWMLLGATSLVAAPRAVQAAVDVYNAPWPVSVPATQPFDWTRWSGPAEQYERVTLAEALKDGRAFYGRRLHFTGAITWGIGLADSAPVLSAPGAAGTGPGVVPAIRTQLGVAHPVPPVLKPGDDASAMEPFVEEIECFGTIDWYVDQPAAPDTMPGAGIGLAIPRRLDTRPGFRLGWDRAARPLRTGDDARDAEPIAFLLNHRPDRAKAVRAVRALEARLSVRRPTDLAAEKRDFFLLGWLHERYTGDLARAAAAYRRARRDYSAVAGYQGATSYREALCLYRLGHRAEAKAALVEFVRAYPRDLWVTQACDLLAALRVPRAGLHLDLTSRETALTDRAIECFRASRFGGEARALEAVMATSPHDGWSRLRAAIAYTALGDVPRARRCITDFLRVAPQWSEFLDCALGSSVMLVPQADLAELPVVARGCALWSPVQNRHPGYLPVELLYADLRDRTRQFPNDPLPHYLRARLRQTRSTPSDKPHPVDGVAEMRRASELAPRNWLVQLWDLQYFEWIAPDSPARDNVRLIRDAEAVLSAAEGATWGLHSFLANLYADPAVGNAAQAGAHRRRYEALRRRRAKERPKRKVLTSARPRSAVGVGTASAVGRRCGSGGMTSDALSG